ncbi:type II toxin-antitoxin system PemK/MazF family toxin (plasmid) [Ligilactobacillus salivarius]|uniref:Type II toxin-antitoxin system PemK/MazF family toxin n=1 Tax=Ligilactobacillus salivarius TaxID=1624 RepID=A0ABD7YXN4_9LACO|nr:type II toxin-antitoxin system PemK/MazF family toxin [Ligilactobacillus salivarius]WHS05081.1 type II toxin-antitoxin system PemK/MazF family toxin [Ligilactobacillus salivarius]WHS09169.1 type II toxin-antitoxin system PemK/MazF family toxin [Ligilactobacillus salivarius]WHS11190.1 type II toxin-antitoxin system PemK/MazF family toxin [Ligilactobacillus salivarius]WHS15192.1 type II toxin-antitoxin system PemK/MazF family toxin [Ligilactobacillus salivarius]WHS18616.1 type II toxin-antito
MKINDIYTAYVSWPGGGKRRPVLIIEDGKEKVTVFKITTKYEQKSDRIKKNYFPISNWKESGLDKQSYIDTNRKKNLPKDKVTFKKVGRLSEKDLSKFNEFTKNR